MAFSAEISRTNPTCLLFLVDQSKSMNGPFGGQPGKKKSEGVADAINRLLQNLVLKCAKADGVRDYFHVGVIGYGATVGPCLAGTTDDQPLAPISTVANSPLRLEQRQRMIDDGAGGLVEQAFRFPVWFEPTAGGKTPMNEAITRARSVVSDFVSTYPDCFPPMVLNLTDGKPTDANPLDAAVELKRLKSSDGNVLVFNAHLSSSPAPAVCFPDDEKVVPDQYGQLLFKMSSILPPKLMAAARDEGYTINGPARGFVFNADLVAVIRFLDIGTRVNPGR
ncbi:MAG TPA: vWA domain-containing protein [Gemmataceae bacterium]|nr:vWA domain-containing protein [Gemmataceae bacterium]